MCANVLMRKYSLAHLLSSLVTVLVCTVQYIERLKKEDSRERLSWWLAVKEVFGHPFSYRWFSPFHAGPQTAMEVDELYAVL